jgi:N-acetylmuramoyl-L-alanine amidase
MFTIQDHWLQGPGLIRQPTDNHGGVIRPVLLVFHYTACSYEAARDTFLRLTGSNRTSAHLIVNLDGSVTQLVAFNRRAWHAGESSWGALTDLNTHSIGIEVVNWGYLNKLGTGQFVTSDGKHKVPADQVVEARHKNPACSRQFWHVYTPEQIDTCKGLTTLLTESYGLQDVVGHDDIAPQRKTDPGPAFPLGSLASLALGRGSVPTPDAPPMAEVAAAKLNLRSGPGTAYPVVAAPLVAGTRMRVLKRPAGDWMEVEPVRGDATRGWVFAAYTSVVA